MIMGTGLMWLGIETKGGLVKTVVNLQISQKSGNFLTN
jgi:hypothetical protein